MAEHQSNQEKTTFCLNCESPIVDQADFCHSCGQKANDDRLTVKGLFSEFFDNVFNLDSKIFRTIGAVFIPGQLTNAFLKGQRRKYYHPLRLFLVLMVIFLAGLKYQSEFSLVTNLNKEQINTLKERKRLMTVFDGGIDSISEKTQQDSVLAALDSLSSIFYQNSGKRADSININAVVKITDDFDFFLALEDFGKYSTKEILDIYEVKGLYKRSMVKQKLKMLEDETSFVPFLLGKVTWVVFIVLLLLSLVLRILFFKGDFWYLEHLIFNIHLNSFLLIIASILALFPGPMVSKLLPVAFILAAIYLFIAMKRVYKQSYLLTIFKFVIVFISYFFLFIFGIVATLVGSFLIF